MTDEEQKQQKVEAIPASNQAENTKRTNNNMSGKGGFQERPEDINKEGTWKKNQTFRYWFDVFKEMSIEQLKGWIEANPENTRTVAADLAYRRVINSQSNLKEFREVANRTEGMPKITLEHSGKIVTKVVVEIVKDVE
jgi:hypothetical protein